jgi:hypothetical protein
VNLGSELGRSIRSRDVLGLNSDTGTGSGCSANGTGRFIRVLHIQTVTILRFRVVAPNTSSNFKSMLDAALIEYKKKTGKIF